MDERREQNCTRNVLNQNEVADSGVFTYAKELEERYELIQKAIANVESNTHTEEQLEATVAITLDYIEATIEKFLSTHKHFKANIIRATKNSTHFARLQLIRVWTTMLQYVRVADEKIRRKQMSCLLSAPDYALRLQSVRLRLIKAGRCLLHYERVVNEV